ncbi:MAG: tetratricopeptide repeat protein [Candidatus Nealsonbacteria bacterium]|nr:MAG: tetratricopeptide repeat protein [Candidatus Nealsonbacteria bacterium]
MEILKSAKELYNKGKWNEVINIIDTFFVSFEDNDIAEANRIKGWSYYYKGIKGPEEEKNINIQNAVNSFKIALSLLRKLLLSEKEKAKDTEVSAKNGLALSLWILGKKEEAKIESLKATEKFPQEPSIWNIRAILYRWAKDFEESVKICEKVYETAIKKKDFRTAGHGKHNRADALKELGKLGEAKKDYQEALKLYKKYEKESGESAKFHIDKVEEKISNL